MTSLFRNVALIVCGAALGATFVSWWDHRTGPPATLGGQALPPAARSGEGGDATMEADVAYLKDIRPSQSHTMMDVGYQWTNLWFAAQQRNWPLARFYFNETRSHIRWTVRVRPIRKHPDGSPVDIKAIYDAIDSSAMETVKQAIEAKDATAFVAAYKQMLESCYACHKANGHDFLRPAVPTRPGQSIINFSPDASWPQ